MAEGKLGALFLAKARGWVAAPLSSALPVSRYLLPASVPLQDRHVLPTTQLLSQLLSSCLSGQSTRFHRSRHRFLQVALSFHMYIHSQDAQIQWDQPAGIGASTPAAASPSSSGEAISYR